MDLFYGFATGAFMFANLIYLAICALMIVTAWFIFAKADEPGWAAIIPFYNSYILYKITWGNGWFFLLLFIPFANFVIMIITMVKLAQVFGKGGGWACGLIFLSLIFMPIMAFSKDIQYIGIDGQGTTYAPSGGYQNPYGQQNPSAESYQQNTYNQAYTQQSTQNPEYHYQRSEPQTPTATIYCGGCGAPIDEGSKFCMKCGKQI